MTASIQNSEYLLEINGNGGLSTVTETRQEVDVSAMVEVVTNEEQFDQLEHDWNALLERPEVEADIFQTFDWQREWWNAFGGENKLHILTVRKEDRLIGIAPFFVDLSSILGLYEYKVLKLIGSSIPNRDAVGGFTSYSISDYLDVIIDPEHRDLVVGFMIDYLDKSRHTFDEIEANELSENSQFMNHLMPEIKNHGWEFEKRAKEVCPQIKLPGTTEEYLDNLDRKARYELRYSKRAVTEKELFKVYRVQDEDELDSAFEEFVDLHQRRWNRLGYPGIFANKQYQSFLKDVARAFLNRNILNMSTAVDNDGQCIAVDFAFQFKGRVYDYQKAFDADCDLAKYSPGRALTYFLIDDAIIGQNKCVDLLRGAEKYKLRFTNHTARNWMVTINGAGPVDSLKEFLHGIVLRENKLKERVGREWLLIKVHIKQWGLSGFLPRYFGFLKDRINTKS